MKYVVSVLFLFNLLVFGAGCTNADIEDSDKSESDIGESKKALSEDDTFVFPDDPPPEPGDYRTGKYRTVVPLTLKGARVVDDKAAMELYQKKETLFIDVMPHVPKPPNLPKGMIFREKPRSNIPGSHWLANVGYGRLPKEMDEFFRENLKTLTGNNNDKPLLFYCQKDCWMSWNAAKRALEYGYTKVFWYPVGTDGWVTIGGKIERAKPVPLPQLTRALKKSTK